MNSVPNAPRGAQANHHKAQLLERDGELLKLGQALERARGGSGTVVLLGGEAGIGKTTLVDALCAGQSGGISILRGYCDPLLTPSVLEPLYDIALALGLKASSVGEDSSQIIGFFNELLGVLRDLAKPVLLVIEDLHWADEATLDFVRFLSRRIGGERILFIATYRDDEADRRPALRRLLGLLSPSHSLERLKLLPLSLEAVRSIAAGRVKDTETLFRQTGGNPFFVTEIAASPAPGIPASVRDAVLARAAQLGPKARAFLDYLSIAGMRVEFALLEPLEEDGSAALSECMGYGMIVEARDGVSFRHELARKAILEAINPLARRRLYRQVLDAARAAGFEHQGQFARLAHYAEGAGSAAEVQCFAEAAAARAALAGAHREAAAHYRTVLRFSDDAAPADRARLHGLLGREAMLTDVLDEAIAAYQTSIEAWTELGDGLRRGETLANLAWALVRNGDNAGADAAVESAIAALEPLGPTAELASAYRMKSHLAMLDRDLDRAVAIGSQAAALARATGGAEINAAAEMVIGTAMLLADDAAGHIHIARCLDIARDHRLDDMTALALMNTGSALGEQYRFDSAEAELTTGLSFARDRDLDLNANYLASWLALVKMFRGHWAEAEAMARTILAQEGVSPISRIMALVTLGRVFLRRGNAEAGPVLDQALALARPTSTLQRLAPVHAARAEHAWLAGDTQQAAAEARAILPLAMARRHAWHSGELLFWLAKAGEAPEPCSWAAEPYALQQAGKWQEAAAAWAARGCPYEEARALADGDVEARHRALRIFGDLGAEPAAAMLRRQLREAGEVQIPRGPRESTRSSPFGLTSRERDVLARLAAGDSNRAIAAALFISAKTVDHHVSAILSKLGAATRKEASDIARKHALAGQNGDPPDIK